MNCAGCGSFPTAGVGPIGPYLLAAKSFHVVARCAARHSVGRIHMAVAPGPGPCQRPCWRVAEVSRRVFDA